jgi:hypothetical protein
LSLVASRNEGLDWTAADPDPDYLYAFAYPENMVLPQYMADFTKFSLGLVGETKVINSNNISPILYYTRDDEDPVRWEPGLYHCVVWSLAACINMAKNGKMALTQKLEQQVVDLIGEAGTNAANADDTYFESVPSFYAGTEFRVPGHQTRFIYPTNSFRISGLVK